MQTGHLHRKQLRGWLSYAFASEVFVVVSLTLFLPICLEQFARDNGFLDLPGRSSPCATSDSGAPSDFEKPRCVVKLGWVWIDSASFSLYVYSISVALQALTVISMGGIADRPAHRKKLLLTFAALGAASAIIFLFLSSSSPLWLVAALLAVCSNVGFGASVVAMNSYLPLLAKSAPDVVRTQQEIDSLAVASHQTNETVNPSDAVADDVEAPLLEHDLEPQQLVELKQQYTTQLSVATSRISAQGIALGYSAGIILLALTLIPVTKLGGSTLSLRLAIGASGIWWALFSIPAALWLPGAIEGRSTEEMAAETYQLAGDAPKWTLRGDISSAWKRLAGMLRWREIRKLRNTFRYLAAWFLLSDGFTTITSTAVLFGKTSLGMAPSSLILIGVLTPSAGILGSLVWPFVQRRLQLSNLRILVTLVVMASAIPAYGCLGFLPPFRQGKARFGGLTTPGEMYGLAVYFGAVYGAFQSYARALYAELIPAGEEARWYGLFSITDKSSSFLGPLVVGLIADATGNIRYSFFFLVGMIWLAVPVLVGVDVTRGRQDAANYVYVR